ncbi:MAG: hypothetical protein R6V39_01040, partial [Desulfovibrionales bacterium]
VWQILNALRAHDERLDARINQADLGEDISNKVDFIRISSESEMKDLTAVVDDFATSKTKAEKTGADNRYLFGKLTLCTTRGPVFPF